MRNHLNNLLKQCATRTGMMVPVIVHKVDTNEQFKRVEIVGRGFIIYNSQTMQVQYDIVDHEGNELPAEFYSLEQEYEKCFLVVYSSSVN